MNQTVNRSFGPSNRLVNSVCLFQSSEQHIGDTRTFQLERRAKKCFVTFFPFGILAELLWWYSVGLRKADSPARTRSFKATELGLLFGDFLAKIGSLPRTLGLLFGNFYHLGYFLCNFCIVWSTFSSHFCLTFGKFGWIFRASEACGLAKVECCSRLADYVIIFFTIWANFF